MIFSKINGKKDPRIRGVKGSSERQKNEKVKIQNKLNVLKIIVRK